VVSPEGALILVIHRGIGEVQFLQPVQLVKVFQAGAGDVRARDLQQLQGFDLADLLQPSSVRTYRSVRGLEFLQACQLLNRCRDIGSVEAQVSRSARFASWQAPHR